MQGLGGIFCRSELQVRVQYPSASCVDSLLFSTVVVSAGLPCPGSQLLAQEKQLEGMRPQGEKGGQEGLG